MSEEKETLYVLRGIVWSGNVCFLAESPTGEGYLVSKVEYAKKFDSKKAAIQSVQQAQGAANAVFENDYGYDQNENIWECVPVSWHLEKGIPIVVPKEEEKKAEKSTQEKILLRIWEALQRIEKTQKESVEKIAKEHSKSYNMNDYYGAEWIREQILYYIKTQTQREERAAYYSEINLEFPMLRGETFDHLKILEDAGQIELLPLFSSGREVGKGWFYCGK